MPVAMTLLKLSLSAFLSDLSPEGETDRSAWEDSAGISGNAGHFQAGKPSVSTGFYQAWQGSTENHTPNTYLIVRAKNKWSDILFFIL